MARMFRIRSGSVKLGSWQAGAPSALKRGLRLQADSGHSNYRAEFLLLGICGSDTSYWLQGLSGVPVVMIPGSLP